LYVPLNGEILAGMVEWRPATEVIRVVAARTAELTEEAKRMIAQGRAE